MINDIENSEDKGQIGRRAGQGIFWNFLTYGLGRAGVLLTTSILARLLSKDDFGLVAIAVVAINYFGVIKDLGLGVALIQRREDVSEAANTVFTINIILGFFLSAAIIPFAPLFAGYFNNPMITPVLRWLGASFAINALGSVHNIWLMRELDYRRKFIPDMGNTVIKILVSIGLAFGGFGVWSLVFGQILGALASVVLVWIILPWRPRLTLNKKITASLLKFGRSIIGGDILTVVIDNLDYIIVGRIFGVAQLSVYTLAYRLPEMLVVGNLWVLGAVIFPAFSSIQDRPDEMRRGFLTSVRLIAMIIVPICLGLVIAADPIVRVLFGDQWLDVIPLLQVLAIYAWLYSLGYHIGDIYKAIGRPDILLKLGLLSLIILIPAMLIGSQIGLIGIAWGHLIAVLIRRIVSLQIATRFVDVSLVDIFNELKPSFLGGLLMAPVTLTVLILTAAINPVLQLVSVVVSGAISYLCILWWVERENLLRLFRVIGLSPT
ncbi:MAG: lipopolysaccharide biosynthesis protein [Planctomycetes bacterium]|nr:lipopolysaccharide biosynthesis protein [Planctomycetota bacterium]